MPLDPSIPMSGVQQPQMLNTLSGMLNMRNAAQQYQNLQTQNQIGQAELKQKQNMLGEYQAARDYLSNPDTHAQILDANGNIDMNKAAPVIMKIAPTIGPQMLQSLSQANESSTAAKQAISNLNEDSRVKVGQFVLAQKGKDPETVFGNLDAFARLNPQLAPAVDFAKKYALGPSSNDPQAFDQAILKVGQSVMNPTQQAAAMTPSGYETGNNVQHGLMNTNPMAGGVGVVPGTVVNNQIPLNERQNVGYNPITGNPTVTSKDAFGNVTGVTNAPSGPGVPSDLKPGDKELIPQFAAEANAARQTAMGAGNMHENNRIIMSNIDNVGATGLAGQGWKNIASAFGFGGKTPENEAAAYDLVGKALERNALQAAQSMGPQTNAGLEAQVRANGSLGYTPSAIKQLTRLNDGIVTGSQFYSAGLDKAAQASPNGPLAKREYDQAWAQNFDPRIYMLYNMQKNGDKEGMSQLKRELGQNGMQQLLKKAANLNALYSQGHL